MIASYGPWFRTGRRQDRTGKDTTVKGLDIIMPRALRSSPLIASHGPWPAGAIDKTGQDRTGKWDGQDRTGLENGMDWRGGLDSTIPEAWRSS